MKILIVDDNPTGRNLLCRILHGFDDVLIAGATAEIAVERVADLLVARVRAAVEQIDRRHDHARCAEAALKPVLLPETFLDRMELPVRRHPFDGLHLCALALDGQERAGLHRLTVQVDGTGPTQTQTAAEFGSLEVEFIT